MTSQATSRRPRSPLAVRIALGAFAALLAVLVGLCAWNLRAARLYDQATDALDAAIAEAARPDADWNGLLVRQLQTDDLFASSLHADMLLLPSVRDAAARNAEISDELTRRLERQLADAARSSSGQSDDAASDGSDAEQGALTQEQRRQIEEMLKANQASPSPGDPTTRNVAPSPGDGATADHSAKPW